MMNQNQINRRMFASVHVLWTSMDMVDNLIKSSILFYAVETVSFGLSITAYGVLFRLCIYLF